MHEDKLCDALAIAFRKCLLSATASRTFYAQAVLPKEASSLKSTQSHLDYESSNKRSAQQSQNQNQYQSQSINQQQPTTQPGEYKKAKKAYDPTRLVRTNAAAKLGALEPFLSQAPAQTATTTSTTTSKEIQLHVTECENNDKVDIDMAAPGAFASAILQCDCPPASASSDHAVIAQNQVSERRKRASLLEDETTRDESARNGYGHNGYIHC